MKYLKTFEAYDKNGKYYDEDWIDPTGDQWHHSSKEDIQEAIEEIRALGYANDIDRRIIMIPPDWNTQISVKYWEGHLWIDVLTSELQREQGKATAIMNKLLAIVDKYEVFTAIDPTPYGVGQKMDKQKLVEWAKKFGFYNIVYGNIERTPVISDERYNELKTKGESATPEEREMCRKHEGDITPIMKNPPEKEEYDDEEETFSRELTKEDIIDVFVTALEGGSNSWYYIETIPNEVREIMKTRNLALSEAIGEHVLKGGYIEIRDAEDEDDVLGNIDMNSLLEAITIMKKNFTDNYRNIIDEQYDASDADVFFQLATMGKVVFG